MCDVQPSLSKYPLCRRYSDRLSTIHLVDLDYKLFLSRSKRICSSLSRYCTACWTRTHDPPPRCRRCRGSCGRGPSKHFTHIKRFPYVHLASNTICHDHESTHQCRISDWPPETRNSRIERGCRDVISGGFKPSLRVGISMARANNFMLAQYIVDPGKARQSSDRHLDIEKSGRRGPRTRREELITNSSTRPCHPKRWISNPATSHRVTQPRFHVYLWLDLLTAVRRFAS